MYARFDVFGPDFFAFERGGSSLIATVETDYRPSMVYKILAHMISARVQPFLPDLIHGSQTGFV